MSLLPRRVIKELDDVSLVEVFEHCDDGSTRLAGYYVYGGRGDSSILHPTLEAAEAEFLRRSWR